MAKIYSRYNQRSSGNCQYRPSSLYTITSYSRDSLHSKQENIADDGSYEGSYTSIIEEMPSDNKVFNGQSKFTTKTSLKDVCEKTPVYVHSYCNKYGCGQPYQPKSFANYYDERTEYLSKKFNNLTLAKSNISKTSKSCKVDCPIHSKQNTSAKCCNAKVDQAVIKQLEESYWAKWKPHRDSTICKDASNNKIKSVTDRNKTNRQIRTEVDSAKKQTCDQCGMLEKCKECLKYIQRDKDVKCLHKKDIGSESSIENHTTTCVPEDATCDSESEEMATTSISVKQNPSPKSIAKPEATRDKEAAKPTRGIQRKANCDQSSSGKSDATDKPFCGCNEEPTKDLQSNEPSISTTCDQLSVISKEREMKVHQFDRRCPDFSAISEVQLNPKQTWVAKSNPETDDKQKLPCSNADCTAAGKNIIENDTLPLKHTDSYILNIKRSSNDKPHYPQPTAIKLSNTHNPHSNNTHNHHEPHLSPIHQSQDKIQLQNERERTQNQFAENQRLHNQSLQNQPIHNQFPQNQPTHNQLPQNQSTHNQFPQNQPTHNQSPQNQPTHQFPQNQPTHNQFPQNQPTHNQFPQPQPTRNQYPQNQPTYNQFPQNKLPLNHLEPNQTSQNQSAENQLNIAQNLLTDTTGRTRLTTKLHSYPLRPILRKRPTSSAAKRKF